MRLVHFSDCHIGYRQFVATTKQGFNQREVDVALTFMRVIDKSIALDPQLVVIGGDVFHSVRPSNTAITHALNQFRRLRTARPNTEVVLVAGNHDTPRESNVGSILPALDLLGIHVVHGAARAIDFPALDCRVLAVPDNQHERPALTPSGTRRHNVLLLHGETGIPNAQHEIADADMHADQWSYIALGHWHVYREIAPNEFYSGSIDYTSSNIWGEQLEERERGIPGKGIAERDLETGVQTFHPLPPTRELLELEPINAFGLPGAQVSEILRGRIDDLPDGVEGKIVRVKVTDLEPEEKKQLDYTLLRELRAKALDFDLITKAPEKARKPSHVLARNRAPLSQIIEQALRERELPDDIDREEFVALGADYIDKAEEKTRETAAEPVRAVA